MSVKVVDEAGKPFALEPAPVTNVLSEPSRKRKFNRPTSPELEALFFKVAVHLTKREMALIQWCMGRAPDGGKALAELFLHPEPVA